MIESLVDQRYEIYAINVQYEKSGQHLSKYIKEAFYTEMRTA